MIFLQYTETCEELLDYPMIGVEDTEGFEKKAIMNIFHANSYVHSRILIADFPEIGIKCIEKLQSYCAKLTFADKSRHDRIFQQVTHRGKSDTNYIKNIPKCIGFISFCRKFLLRISNGAHISI